MARSDQPRQRQPAAVRELVDLLRAGNEAGRTDPVADLTGMAASRAAALTGLARKHGVEAWLAGWAPLAEPSWAELAEQRPRFLAAQVRTAAAVREFGRLLDGPAIDWLVLKGPALAHSVYPRPDLRHYVDLDLLVSPRDFSAVLAVLQGAGYQLVDRNWPLLAAQRPGELRLRSPRGVLLDLHWSIFNDAVRRSQFQAPTDRLLGARRRLPAGFPALSATDQLVHAGLHAALSGANRLGWLLDVHLAAAEAGTDWSAVRAAALRIGAGPSLALVLGRCHRLLGTTLPAGLLSGLAGGRAWPALVAGLDRLSWPVTPDPERPSLARSLARSARASGAASNRELARHAWLWLRAGASRSYVRPAWLEADNPASALRDVPDELARQDYLRSLTAER